MKKWDILYKLKTENSNLKTADILEILLKNRGLKTQKEIDAFLHPDIEDVTIESAGIDEKELKKTLVRINTAIKKKEQIIIYGDYDVDGITSSAILWETLYASGASVKPYIPHRVDEGYGLSIKGVSNVKLQIPGLKLIITVDNGIVAHEAVEFAKQQGIDVIITDHHTTGEKLPDAYSIVHTTKLCGAGIAYLLAKKFQMENGKWKMENDQLLELATLGTIADLVPLTATNRIIVNFGLKQLSKTKRVGLKELFREAGCDNTNIGIYEVGHIIAPRLNATGRMASAMDSLRLICTKDPKRAEELASLLGTTNRERQEVMLDATKHASLSVHAKQELKKLLIVSNEKYSEGVIGLVAGRLVEEFYRPSIVISKGEKLSKGSVRSIKGFNIIEFLRQSSEYFVNVGGHPMAAGFTIETEKIEKMTEALEKFAHETLHNDLFIRTIKIDCEVPLYLITESFYSALQQLGPFGMGNPEPTFLSRNAVIEDMRVLGKEGKHLRLIVSQTNSELTAIAFGMGDRAQDLHIGDSIDLVFTVDENTWNGRTTLQLKVKDISEYPQST